MAGLPGAQGPPGFKVRHFLIHYPPFTLSAVVLTTMILTRMPTWAPVSRGLGENGVHTDHLFLGLLSTLPPNLKGALNTALPL